MPFTLAHPAAVWPLRRYGELSALVIGSMAPDAGYLVMVRIAPEISHSLRGLFLFCLPLGLLAYLIYHHVVRQALLAIAPDGIRLRLAERTSLPSSWRAWLWIVHSLILGSATHIVWDALAQARWLVAWLEIRFPQSAGWWFTIEGEPVGWVSAFRFGSTVLGLGLLALWAARAYARTLPRHESSAQTVPAAVRVWLAASVAIAALAITVLVASSEHNPWAHLGFGGRCLRLSVGALSFSLLTYGVTWHIWRAFRR